MPLDLKTFLTDPQFEEQRNLMGAFFEHKLEEAAQKKKEQEEAEEKERRDKSGVNLFDAFFGKKRGR